MSNGELARLQREVTEAEEAFYVQFRVAERIKRDIVAASPELAAADQECCRLGEVAAELRRRISAAKLERREKIDVRLKALAAELGMDEDELREELE